MLLRSLLVSLFCLAPFSAFGQATAAVDDRIEFTTPKAPWTVSFNAKNFKIKSQQVKEDGRSGYFLMGNEAGYFTVSLWIEPVDKCSSSKECRDHILNLGNPGWGKYQDLVKAEFGDISYFEFYRPVIFEQPAKMFDMYAEFVRDGYWIDLHMSKVLYKKEDHAWFEQFVRSASFATKPK
jgi:hypothetical protein